MGVVYKCMNKIDDFSHVSAIVTKAVYKSCSENDSDSSYFLPEH